MVEGVTVRNVTSPEYVGVSESDTIDEVIDLALREGVSTVVVVRGSESVGMVTERDLLAAIADDRSTDTPVGEVMEPPEPTIPSDARIEDAIDVMRSQDVRQLLVLDGEDVLGVLSEHDIITATASLGTATDSVNPQEGQIGATIQSGDPGAAEVTESDHMTQSVCEVCGTLTRELRNVNGQLICTDCRDV